jgi:hypothetical protein
MPTAPFWGSQFSDPKRKFRWIVRFTNTDHGALQLAAKNVRKPSFEIGSVAHKWLNHTFHFPARLEWKEVSLSLVDIGGERDIVTIIDEMMTKSGYTIPEDPQSSKRAITKGASVSAFGNEFQIVQLDHKGNDIEAWILVNPWIKMVDYGDLDYGADDLVEIGLTIQYDYARKDPDIRVITGGDLTDLAAAWAGGK